MESCLYCNTKAVSQYKKHGALSCDVIPLSFLLTPLLNGTEIRQAPNPDTYKKNEVKFIVGRSLMPTLPTPSLDQHARRICALPIKNLPKPKGLATSNLRTS